MVINARHVYSNEALDEALDGSSPDEEDGCCEQPFVEQQASSTLSGVKRELYEHVRTLVKSIKLNS